MTRSGPNSIYRVNITARAARNLRSIFRYVDAASSEQAATWFNRLTDSIGSLERSPERCPLLPNDNRRRHLLYGRGRSVYRIIFLINEADRSVTVIHIRHTARVPSATPPLM